MKIGVTDCLREDKLKLYVDWLKKVDPSVEIEILSARSKDIGALENIGGLLLTGGGDVDPELYGRNDLRSHAKDVNPERDKFEIDLVRRTIDSDIPVLGVCRGMQVMNVALGGTLRVDLASEGFNHHSSAGNEIIHHSITIEPNSLLSGLAGGLEQTVNSYHHQAVHTLGKSLKTVAESPDGVIEAAEWSSKEGMSFLLLVQWHPERVTNDKDIFSFNLAKIFLREVEYSTTNKTTDTSRR